MNGFIKIFVNNSLFRAFQNGDDGWGYLSGNEHWNIELFIPVNNKIRIDEDKVYWG